MFMSPKFMYENLIPNVMVFGGGAFMRWLGHEGRDLMNRISAFIEETQRVPLSLLLCEDIGTMPFKKKEVGSHQALNLLAT